jgi:adenosine deaminase
MTVHLDGSLRVETLIELAEKEGLGFDRQTIEDTFKDKYMNLEEYLGGFQYTVAVMQNAEVLLINTCIYTHLMHIHNTTQ